ncbi:MAG TPA: hypothetical protein VM536_16455 [Chloroflexia bacterium]|nr:hypothetical protein [Chloroflexia bacterium]
MACASPGYMRLARARTSALERVFLRGEAPAAAALAGFEYRGYNVAPALALFGIRQFIKAFFMTPGGAFYGCNTPVVQNGLTGPWTAKPSDTAPRRFAFFSVTAVDPDARDNAYLHALLLDYGRGGNPLFDPSRVLRDYVVRVVPGSDDLLLGKAYVALGPLRIAGTFFVLQRHRPLPGPVALPAGARPGD